METHSSNFKGLLQFYGVPSLRDNFSSLLFKSEL